MAVPDKSIKKTLCNPPLLDANKKLCHEQVASIFGQLDNVLEYHVI
jgi:hypothetical protein